MNQQKSNCHYRRFKGPYGTPTGLEQIEANFARLFGTLLVNGKERTKTDLEVNVGMTDFGDKPYRRGDYGVLHWNVDFKFKDAAYENSLALTNFAQLAWYAPS